MQRQAKAAVLHGHIWKTTAMRRNTPLGPWLDGAHGMARRAPSKGAPPGRWSFRGSAERAKAH